MKKASSKKSMQTATLISVMQKILISDKGIVKKAARENSKKCQGEGIKGKTLEYYVSSMSSTIQLF